MGRAGSFAVGPGEAPDQSSARWEPTGHDARYPAVGEVDSHGARLLAGRQPHEDVRNSAKPDVRLGQGWVFSSSRFHRHAPLLS